VSSGFEIEEVNIWDSSPGKEGFIDRIDSIVTFNYLSVLIVSCPRVIGYPGEHWRGRRSEGRDGSEKDRDEDSRVVYIIRISLLG
jgi:hypothetical protein